MPSSRNFHPAHPRVYKVFPRIMYRYNITTRNTAPNLSSKRLVREPWKAIITNIIYVSPATIKVMFVVCIMASSHRIAVPPSEGTPAVGTMGAKMITKIFFENNLICNRTIENSKLFESLVILKKKNRNLTSTHRTHFILIFSCLFFRLVFSSTSSFILSFVLPSLVSRLSSPLLSLFLSTLSVCLSSCVLVCVREGLCVVWGLCVVRVGVCVVCVCGVCAVCVCVFVVCGGGSVWRGLARRKTLCV